MLLPPPFPTSVDQLTTQLLGNAVGTPVIDWSAQRIGEDRGMLGSIHLITLHYGRDAAGPEQIVAKFASPREGSLASARRGGTHERELRFFDQLRDVTPVSAPTNYGTWYDPETAEFLLLQSAIEADETVDQIVGLSIDDAALVVAEAASFHARWFEDESLLAASWLPALDSEQRLNNLTTLAAAGWAPLCELLGDCLTPSEQALGVEFPDRLRTSLTELARLPTTLIHSDLRADNLLFAHDRSGVTLIDWQGCGIGPVSFDLAYFLTQSLSVTDRRAHERELLELYRDGLAEAGVDRTLDDVMAGYGTAVIYGLVIACAIPLIGDSSLPRVEALTNTMARRAIEALRDHDQLWETTQ